MMNTLIAYQEYQLEPHQNHSPNAQAAASKSGVLVGVKRKNGMSTGSWFECSFWARMFSSCAYFCRRVA